MDVVIDPRVAGGTPPHPGNPSWEQLLGPVADRFLHPIDPAPVGLSATFWNPATGQDEEVRVMQFLRREQSEAEAGHPVFVVVMLGDRRPAVQASLLCEVRDGVPAPRYRRIRVALHNAEAGRAIVFDDDGQRYEVEAVGEREINFSSTCQSLRDGLHVGMWLQPAGARGFVLEEPAPFAGLQKQMRDRLALTSILQTFVFCIDPEVSGHIRRIAGEELEKKLAAFDADVIARFREIVLAGELSATASTRDAPMGPRGAALLAEVVGKWGHRPS